MAHHFVAQLNEQSSLSMASASTPSTPEHSKSYNFQWFRPDATTPPSQTRLSAAEHSLTAPETPPSRPFAGGKSLLTSPRKLNATLNTVTHSNLDQSSINMGTATLQVKQKQPINPTVAQQGCQRSCTVNEIASPVPLLLEPKAVPFPRTADGQSVFFGAGNSFGSPKRHNRKSSPPRPGRIFPPSPPSPLGPGRMSPPSPGRMKALCSIGTCFAIAKTSGLCYAHVIENCSKSDCPGKAISRRGLCRKHHLLEFEHGAAQRLLTGTDKTESHKMNKLAFDVKEAREDINCKLKLCEVEVELVAFQETAKLLQGELHDLQRQEVERQDADAQWIVAFEKLSKVLEHEVHAHKVQSSQMEHLETQNATLIAELEQCRREVATAELQTTVNVKRGTSREQEKEDVERMLATASYELLTLQNQVMSNSVSTDLFKAELSESHATAAHVAKKNQELVLEANGYKKDLVLALEKQLRAECSLAQHSTDWNAERTDLLSRAKEVTELETTLARTKTELSEARAERDGKEAAEAECTRLASLVEHADRNIKEYVAAGEESAREIERLCAALGQAETATMTEELSNAKIFALVGTSERTMVLTQSELKKSMMEVSMLQRQLETSERKLALTQSELKECIGSRWHGMEKGKEEKEKEKVEMEGANFCEIIYSL